MTDRLRAVFDTNVFISAVLSRSPTSPTKELIDRWRAGEFTLLISDALLVELVEKLQEKSIDPDRITDLVTSILQMAEWVDVPAAAVRPVIVGDPDDDHVLACAVVGNADYLVTYDPHFDLRSDADANTSVPARRSLVFRKAWTISRSPGAGRGRILRFFRRARLRFCVRFMVILDV